MNLSGTLIQQRRDGLNQTQKEIGREDRPSVETGHHNLVSRSTTRGPGTLGSNTTPAPTASLDQITYPEIGHLTESVKRARRSHLTEISGMKKWEGRVLTIDSDYFLVELTALGSPGLPLEAEFTLDLLSDEDRKELHPGSVIYVTVRTVTGVSGLRERTSALRLRRLGKWTDSELERAWRRASRLSDSLADLAD